MSTIDVYLELREDGQCIAHLLALPGCFVVGRDQAAAMAKLPDAVKAYAAWSAQHGEQNKFVSEPLDFAVAETVGSTGALHPDDQAALFAPEKAPLSQSELERFLRLAAYNRADLLAAIRGLSGTMRHWRPGPNRMSIEQILRHIARADRWYVSRLWAEAEVPADWFAPDDEIPTMRFLTGMRETAVSHLRRLSTTQRNRVFTPAFRTENPTEQWSARKVMRRFLEHEREHIEHIYDNLAQWRQQLHARIAAERAYFFMQLRSLSEDVLSTHPVSAGWTAKELLPHVAMWDAFHTGRLDLVKNGNLEDIEIINPQIMHERNEQALARFRQMPLMQAFATCLKERSGYLAMLARLTDHELQQVRRLPSGERTTAAVWANRRWRHDAAHADELVEWRATLPRELLFGTGPKFILRAILHTARKSFLTLIPLIPKDERGRLPVCGVWTMKDLIGHLTDWEKVGVDGLQQLAVGKTPEFTEAITDFDAWNYRHAAARADQSWDDVWADFTGTRQTLLSLLEQVTDEDLKRPFIAPWGPQIHGYYLTVVWPVHEMEHAVDVRHALQLPGLPRRLRAHK